VVQSLDIETALNNGTTFAGILLKDSGRSP
jgi:hypothetical protein